MGQLTHFSSGFLNGLSVRGLPMLNSYPGKIFWAGSTIGGGRGTYEKPFSTIQLAHDACEASRGDIILVRPGHVETVIAAAGLSLTKAGVAIVGLGTGTARAKINFTTVVGADMDIDAANITICNLLLTGGLDALTGPLDINASDFTMLNCETRDVTGQATDFIVTDDNCDRMMISGWKHLGAAAAGADTAISTVGGDDWVIEDFDIYGNFAVAAIENVTTASNRVRIGGTRQSYAWTEHAADVIVAMVATSTGFIGPNINAMLQDNASNITEAFVGAAMQFMQPIMIVNSAGESSIVTNITASTD